MVRPNDVSSHHKLVKTTPKPRATKNRSGELVGPLFDPGLLADVEAAGGPTDVPVGVAMADTVEVGSCAWSARVRELGGDQRRTS